ncbi:MAG: hypothetical protein ACRC7V_03605, partial [Lachnospiraceae bacterium]
MRKTKRILALFLAVILIVSNTTYATNSNAGSVSASELETIDTDAPNVSDDVNAQALVEDSIMEESISETDSS